MPSELARELKPGHWAAFVPPGRGSQWPWNKRSSGIFGFLLLSLITAATVYWGVQYFEGRLNKNARADLASSGVDLDELELDWDYRNVTVSGILPAGVTEQDVLATLRETDGAGIREISMLAKTAPIVQTENAQTGTVNVNATLVDGRIILQGSVLSAAQRDLLYDAATQAVGSENIIRRVEVSGLQEAIPGADQRIASFANSIVGLDQASAADAALSATDFRFNATVDDENQVDELMRRRGSAGEVGLVISGDIIAKKSVPGGNLDVTAIKGDDQILLSGVVLSEAQKNLLIGTAQRVVGAGQIIDNLSIAASSEETSLADDRLRVLQSALGTFPEAIDAKANVTVSDFNFDAMVEFEEETVRMNEVRETARAMGLTVGGDIESRRISLAREIALLQGEIDDLAQEIRDNIVFDSSQSELGFEAKKTLDKVVDAMNRYQRPVVLIAGHTDSSGSSIDNELLSLERAGSVREYLENSGIDQLRLRAVGVGEVSPIASNDTLVGKKLNRRVEFTARGTFGN